MLTRLFVGVFALWLDNARVIGEYLAFFWFLFLFLAISPPLSQWQDWLPDGVGFQFWLSIYLLGLGLELVHYFVWLWLGMLKGRPTDVMKYPLLSMKVHEWFTYVRVSVADVVYLYVSKDHEEPLHINFTRFLRGCGKSMAYVCAIFCYSSIMSLLALAGFPAIALVWKVLGMEGLPSILLMWMYATTVLTTVATLEELATFLIPFLGFDVAQLSDDAQQGHTLFQWQRGALHARNFAVYWLWRIVSLRSKPEPVTLIA